jgi:ferritin-like metal-binding protein YciE
MEKMSDLKDLLKHEIQDLYSVEEQIIEALPKMIEKANNNALKNALTEHLRITEEHKNRLDKIQQMVSKEKKGDENGSKKGFLANLFGGGKQVCKGMQGIIEEGNKIMSADMTPEVKDAAIIACAQKVEHYEICGYGTAKSYANELSLSKVTQLLEQTLNEEYEADKKLTVLATGRINRKAEAGPEQQAEKAVPSGMNRSKVPTERAKSRGKALEPVNNVRTQSGSAHKDGKPKASESTRNAGGTRSSSTRQTTANGRRSGTGTKPGNSGRSSSGGRGSSSRSR